LNAEGAIYRGDIGLGAEWVKNRQVLAPSRLRVLGEHRKLLLLNCGLGVDVKMLS